MNKIALGTVAVLAAAWMFSASAYEVIEDFESPGSASRIMTATTKQNGLTLEISDQFVTTGTKALHVKLPKRGPGIVEWPVVSIPLGRTVDFTAYDRILVEMYNHADGGDTIVWYACEEKGDIGLGKRFQTLLPTFTCDQWVTPLDKWPKALNPKNISRLVFFLHPPQNLNLYIGRIALLKKGEAVPGPSAAFIDTVLKPKVRDAFSEIKDSPFITDSQRKTIAGFLANPKATVDEVDAFRRCVAKLKDRVGHLQAYETFRKSCGSQGLLVGEATTMEQVLPRDVNPPRKAERFCVDMARNETEGFQVIVSPAKGVGRNVRVSVTGLKGPCGASFPADRIAVGVVGHTAVTNGAVASGRGYNVRTSDGVGYRRELALPQMGWWPDSILDFLPSCTVEEKDFQSFWVSFRTPRELLPGTYSGSVRVAADGLKTVSIPLSVRIRDFELPKTSPLPIIIPFSPNYRDYPGRDFWRRKDDKEAPIHVWKARMREWTDFLADHFVSPDDLYHWGKDRLEWVLPELKHLKEQGRLGPVNVCYFFPDGGFDDAAYARWLEKGLPRVKTAYAFLKENDLLDTAYVYGGDELNANAFPLMGKMVADVRKACPGLPIATTLHDDSYGSTSSLDYDWFIRTSQDYEQFCGARIDGARARGRKAWWYLCDGPYPPFANFYLQSAAIEGRLLMGAMTQRMKPDGFMMFQLAVWNSKRPITSGPYTDWESSTCTVRVGCADWVHCGPDGKPLSTIRFENFRDGIEDLMYAKLLEAKKKERKGTSDDWTRRAQAALTVPKDVMDTMRNYTDDPRCLYAWRREMADLIEGQH